MKPTDVLIAIVAVVGLAITIASVFGTFRMSRNTQAMTLYRETATGWQAKAELQEGEIAELRENLAKKDRQIADLQARVQVLQDTVTGKSLLEEHHRAFEARSAEILAMMGDTRAIIRQIAEKVQVKTA